MDRELESSFYFKNDTVICKCNTRDIFSKNPLQILILLKVVSIQDLEIDGDISEAMFEYKMGLMTVDGAEIGQIFSELIVGSQAVTILNIYRDIFAVFIPEIECTFCFLQNTPYHQYDVWEHTLKAVENIDANITNYVVLRLVAFFHDIGKPCVYTEDENGIGHFYKHALVSRDITRVVMNRLGFEEEVINHVCLLVENHDRYLSVKRKSVTRFLKKFDIEFFNEYLCMREADIKAQSEHMYNRIDDLIRLKELACSIDLEVSNKKTVALEISGKDLVNIGIPQGKMIGEMLDFLTNEVLEKRLENNNECLVNRAREMVDCVDL